MLKAALLDAMMWRLEDLLRLIAYIPASIAATTIKTSSTSTPMVARMGVVTDADPAVATYTCMQGEKKYGMGSELRPLFNY